MTSTRRLPFSVLVLTSLIICSCNANETVDTTYKWGQWSAYTQCVDCAKGSKSRQRYCLDGNYQHVQDTNCRGHAVEFTACGRHDCSGVCSDESDGCLPLYCTGTYSDWSNEYCKKTCGVCSTGNTPPLDGGWSTWGNLTPCTVTCGRGQTTRHLTCTNPSPSNGGKACQGSSNRVYWCSKPICPTPVPSVNGQWGPWTAYSTCSHSCGMGTMTRQRPCNNPPPSGNGYGCKGDSKDTQHCKILACSLDGGWSVWSHWTKCTTTCDLGVISRDRSCTNPVPTGNGRSCSGNKTETHECSVGPCAVWSHWFEGDCSVSCGNGTMERLRHCSTGRDTDCSGVAYEMVPCSIPECI